jgi:hypothetical protein
MLCGVSTYTIRRGYKDGLITGVRVGSKLMFSEQEVARIQREGMKSPKTKERVPKTPAPAAPAKRNARRVRSAA